DKLDSRLGTCLRETRVFGKKTVAWMDSVSARTLRHPKDLFDIQIGLRRSGWSQMIGLVCLAHVEGRPVDVGVHRHRRNAHLAACAYHAHRDFSTIGDENLLEHEGSR